MTTEPLTPAGGEPRFTPEVARRTADVLERVRRVVPELEWPVHAPYVDAIREWKARRNAVVLAHNYQTPEIFHGVADITGDSLALAQQAARSDADVIVMAGVHFMAETAKILSPDKLVLMPDLEAGCSLAASITAADVRLLRERYPDAPVVTYVNTSAEVKAESDVCCTSANAVEVVESLARAARDLPAGRVPGSLRRVEDEDRDRPVAGPLRGARALHRRRDRCLPATAPGPDRARPPRVPAGRARRLRLRRVHGRDGRPPRDDPPAARRARDRVLDERQRGRPVPRDGVHAAVQPVPAHEADHPAEDPARPAGARAPGRGRAGRRGEGPPRGRAHAGRRPRGRPMSARLDATREADVIVVGAGAAGLSVALGIRHTVDLLAKGSLGRTGSSPWAQGGIAGAVGHDDSPALHAADTLAVAGEIADAAAVAALAGDGPRRLAELVRLGARFDRDADGELDLAREAAHSRRRILHARDATGAEVVRALGAALPRRSGLSVFERATALELVLDGGRAVGVLARHGDGALVLHRARAVVLATGGIGRVYAHTTNPPEATGDGLALAWRAGARLADVEMVQFHPTALDCGADPMPLLTEALRGAGARLVDERGEPLLDGPGAELQARDVVARGIWSALASGRRALLDAREAVGDAFPSRFPTVFEACREHGLDPRIEAIPVAPAAHYHMGGIATDLDGRTSVAGLWAAGEAACTGVHGANRLASNSLLEALVFGARVARSISRALPGLRRSAAGVTSSFAPPADEEASRRPLGAAAADVGRRRPRPLGRRAAARARPDRRARGGDARRGERDALHADRRPAGRQRRPRAAGEPRRALPSGPPACRRRVAAAAGAGAQRRVRARR